MKTTIWSKIHNTKIEDLNGIQKFILVIILIYTFISFSIDIFKAFNDGKDGAIQKEATTLISSLIKAAEAYDIEYGRSVKYAKQLGEYITIKGCLRNDPIFCKYAESFIYSNRKNIDTWNSASGRFKIKIDGGDSIINIRAIPAGDYIKYGYGVAGCYNPINGVSKVWEFGKRGIYVPKINC